MEIKKNAVQVQVQTGLHQISGFFEADDTTHNAKHSSSSMSEHNTLLLWSITFQLLKEEQWSFLCLTVTMKFGNSCLQ